MGAPLELVSFVTRAENRVEALLALASGPRTRQVVQDETGIPRATLSRILADFRDRDLVVRDGHQYELTPLGTLLASELDSLFEAVEGMETLQTVRPWLPFDEDEFPIEHLRDADVIIPAPTDPMAPIRRAEELLADATQVRLLAHSMVPSCLDVVWEAVMDGRQTMEWVATHGAFETVADDPKMGPQSRDLLAHDATTGFVHPDDSLPLVVVVDDLVFIAVTDDAGTIQGHVESTNEAVLAWAHSTIDAYADEADPVSAGVLTE